MHYSYWDETTWAEWKVLVQASVSKMLELPATFLVAAFLHSTCSILIRCHSLLGGAVGWPAESTREVTDFLLEACRLHIANHGKLELGGGGTENFCVAPCTVRTCFLGAKTLKNAQLSDTYISANNRHKRPQCVQEDQ
jgi:hypothetical protein